MNENDLIGFETGNSQEKVDEWEFDRLALDDGIPVFVFGKEYDRDKLYTSIRENLPEVDWVKFAKKYPDWSANDPMYAKRLFIQNIAQAFHVPTTELFEKQEKNVAEGKDNQEGNQDDDERDDEISVAYSSKVVLPDFEHVESSEDE